MHHWRIYLQQSQEFQIELGPCLLLTADTVGGVCVSDVSPESHDGQCGRRHGEVHGHHRTEVQSRVHTGTHTHTHTHTHVYTDNRLFAMELLI